MALSTAPAGSMPSCWAIWYSTGAVILGTAVTGRKAASGNSQEVEISLRQGLPAVTCSKPGSASGAVDPAQSPGCPRPAWSPAAG